MNNQSKILKWSVILGIIIVLNLFFNYALSLVYKQPDYNNFCPLEQVVLTPETQKACTDKGGQWTSNPYYGKTTPPISEFDAAVQKANSANQGYCDLQFTCRQGYDDAMKSYNRNIFVILVLLGALSVLAGNFFGANAVISQGLALAGVLSFVIASMRYWGDANDLIRVVILAIALGVLFWVAWKKFRNA